MNNIFKYLIISSIYFLDKLFILIVPFVTTSGGFYQFNLDYYLLIFISTISLFGYHLAYARNPINKYLLIFLLFLNTSALFLVISFFFNISASIIIIPAAVGYNLIKIFQYRLLFTDSLKKYLSLGLIFNLFLAGIVAIALQTNLSLIYSYLFFLVFAGAVVIFFLENFKPDFSLKVLLIFALSSIGVFIVNSCATLIISYHKLLSSSIIDKSFANSIIFIWILLGPIFFIGHVSERFSYTKNVKDIKADLLKFILLLVAANTLFSFMLIMLISEFPQLLPQSVNAEIISDYLWKFLIGVSLFSVIHYPINSLIFKSHSKESIDLLGKITGIILILSIAGIQYVSSLISLDEIILYNLFVPLFIITAAKLIYALLATDETARRNYANLFRIFQLDKSIKTN
jgi:hypothetical protein